EDTLRRGGLLDVRVQLRPVDATTPALWWDGFTFDAILLDAPCSATGVVRRQPDILLHRRPEDIESLVAAQARLLDAAWPMLRPGGVLLYATCSILPEENAGQVEAFLARTPDAAAVPLPESFGHASGPGRQRLTGEDGMDGFFYARLRKSERPDPRAQPWRYGTCASTTTGGSGPWPCWCWAPGSACAIRGRRTSRASPWWPGRWWRAATGYSRTAAPSCIR